MDRGKRICKTLKELRKRIADANGIPYEIEECPHTEPCPGTCPKCEKELEDLFDQLHWIEQEGRRLNLRGLMSEEELRLFYASGPSQVPEMEEEPELPAGIPVPNDDEWEALQGDVCLPPDDLEGLPVPNFGNATFAMKVVEQLLNLNDDENFVFSPIGIHTALKVLQQGMSINNPIYDVVDNLLSYVDSSIPECRTDEFTLEKGTSLWVDKAKGDVKDIFIDIAKQGFEAEVFNKDFTDATVVKSEIDQWVSEKTHAAIKSLDMNLSPDAFMVILDALYMKAKWESPFDEDETFIKPFKNKDGSTANVKMMNQTFSNPYYEETEDYKSICLPYADDRYRMVIVLPHKWSDFDEVIASENWMYPSETDGDVELSMPKFKFDVKVELIEMLKELGLEAMFDRGDSFPGISDKPINVSQFFQQCTISFDEEGTEAAAVTVVECEVGCLPPDEPANTYRMNVNRPFGFAVKYDDGISDKILFVGVVKQLDNVDTGEIEVDINDNKRLSSITVAGTTHIKNIEELSENIDEGTELRLEHDNGNRYDRYAVALYLGDERVGFVPKGENEIIANLLDAGTPLVATVTNVGWRNNWLCINADIELVRTKQSDLKFSVEPASIADAESIAQFQIDMARESEGTELDRETVLRGVTEGLNDSNKGLYIVAHTDEGEAIASLMITKEWSDWHCEWYWWIQSVFVKPEYRRQGVYKKMYEKVKEMAKESQVASLRLYADKTNSRALAAYHALGMKKSHYLLYEEVLK